MRRIRTLAGKRVLVTGAAGGIGSALALRLAAEGAELILADRDGNGLEQLRRALERKIPESAGKFETYTIDLTSATELEEMAGRLEAGGLDVLVNNAGVVIAGPFRDARRQDIDFQLEVNLMAPVRLTKLLLPLLRKSDAAHIVNVASGAGLAAPAGLCAYSASKFGLVGFSEALRAELAEEGIGVSVVCPAFVKTAIVRNSIVGRNCEKNVDELDRVVHRLGATPDRVAASIVRAIKRNRPRVVIGWWTRPIIAARSFFPALACWLNRKVYARMRKRGLFE
ncbi:MAG: SDR family NAD(P)-dependent oxidoreductase [Deltaproteobacteria bacterium]|nr:MAG: SDR family NAD(P)-dependent oxidoreductase [Deltaproteobacteria bacterium]